MESAIAEPFAESKNAARMPLVCLPYFRRSDLSVMIRPLFSAADLVNCSLDELRIVDAVFVAPREDENVFMRAQRPAIRAEKTNRHRLLPNQFITKVLFVGRDQLVRELAGA